MDGNQQAADSGCHDHQSCLSPAWNVGAPQKSRRYCSNIDATLQNSRWPWWNGYPSEIIIIKQQMVHPCSSFMIIVTSNNHQLIGSPASAFASAKQQLIQAPKPPHRVAWCSPTSSVTRKLLLEGATRGRTHHFQVQLSPAGQQQGAGDSSTVTPAITIRSYPQAAATHDSSPVPMGPRIPRPRRG